MLLQTLVLTTLAAASMSDALRREILAKVALHDWIAIRDRLGPKAFLKFINQLSTPLRREAITATTRYIARFNAQVWSKDDYAEAATARGATDWDVTRHFQGLSEEQRNGILEHRGGYLDLLAEDPSAPAWIHRWTSANPYHVELITVWPDEDMPDLPRAHPWLRR